MILPRAYVGSAVLAGVLLSMFAVATGPGRYGVILPDSMDYAFGAEALLRGQYTVDWDGIPHVPRYSPGFSLLLMPAVALGGINASAWVPYGLALVMGALAAAIAARVSGPLAAPLAVAAVLFARGPVQFAGLVMSDVPTAAIGLAQLGLLFFGSTPVTAAAAGLLGGVMVWMRPGTIAVLAAGLVCFSTRRDWPQWAAVYCAAAGVPLALLSGWQWLTFGSPFMTGYQAASMGAAGGSSLESFFNLAFVASPPPAGDGPTLGGGFRDWGLPNVLFYPLEMTGFDAFICLPGMGVLGLIGLKRLAARRDPAALVGRYGLAAIAATYLSYVAYFYQSGRFMLLPAAILGIGAATLIADGVRTIGVRFGAQRPVGGRVAAVPSEPER